MTVLISKVNQLGDNVVFLPVVQELRRMFPGMRIVVATSPVARDLYTRCVPGAEVITRRTAEFNGAWRRPWHLLSLAAEWRAFKPDAVLLGDDQGNVAHALAWASGAKLRVGPKIESIQTGRLLNHRVPLDLSLLVARQNWTIAGQFVALLGGTLPENMPAPDLSGLVQGTAGGPEIVIHAGASRAYKRWPMDRYVELANLLAKSHQVTWVEQGEEAVGLERTVSRFKPGDLGAFITLLAGARLFIGNNSGPMNIASALGTPGLIFNGPSTANWNPAWHAERFTLLTDAALACQPCDKLSHPVDVCQNTAEPMACMRRWSVEMAAEKARAMLSR